MPRLKADLGPLEKTIMEFVWQRPDTEVTVRDVLESRVGRDHAYTTLMTVLDRLWRKGFVARRRAGRAYFYRAKRSREQYLDGLVREVLARAGDRQSALLGFARAADADDLLALREVIRQVERERKTSR
jgi:predicted transcriptional regulator